MKRTLLRACALLCALGMSAGLAEEAVDLLSVDHRLYELGYRDGACSGELNDVMVNALRNFQLANGLGITGEPDAGTVLVLNSEEAVSQSAYLEGISRLSADMPALSPGSAGDQVARMQRALRELGYFEGESDGAFGDATAEAVRRFQFANGLPVTGTADAAAFLRLYGEAPEDWESYLDGCVASFGDEGEPVRLLQCWLGRLGYFEGECTGRFGESTQRAVRAFQGDCGLEASGDANRETCAALYGNITSLMARADAPRRGSEGAGELCRGLISLGYAAHERFDLQTELALMQFQRANDLPVTGIGDAATMARLSAGDALGFSNLRAEEIEVALGEDFGARLSRQATHLLGEDSDFDEEFGLIQYAYLRCGVTVLERAQFTLTGTELSAAAPGDVMVLEIDGAERCGVTAADGGLIYRAEDGRIVMGYPRAMGAETVRLYRVAGQ